MMNSSGYMSPEYALEGLFSIKSDVFSFGVLLLEILSGKKNTGFYHTGSLNLLGHVCHKIFHFYFCFFEQYDAMRTIHLFHLHKYFDKWIGKVNISYITRSRMHLWTFVLTFTCTVLSGMGPVERQQSSRSDGSNIGKWSFISHVGKIR